MTRLGFLTLVFLTTILLIITVYLRNAQDRMFYHYCKIDSQQGRIKQQLWTKQLKLETILAPAKLSSRTASK